MGGLLLADSKLTAGRHRPGLDRSGLFQYLNMNKLGITLNPETITGRKIFSELLNNADIFVENNPSKQMKELELTYRYVKKINHNIIMTSITPFGQTGPYKDYKGGELVITNMGGEGYVSTRESDISKEPLKHPAHLFSFQAGLSAAAATLGALHHKNLTDSGTHLDVSEQEKKSAKNLLIEFINIQSCLKGLFILLLTANLQMLAIRPTPTSTNVTNTITNHY
jgi:crotonobetainyl-CoA:carnitine CoA-transferase CaiB-like acyl-CoA transferase